MPTKGAKERLDSLLIGEPMTITDAQVRLIMKERTKGKTQEQAAIKANVRSRKTVQKYEQTGQMPSEMKQARGYRTRIDPFEADWAEVKKKLEDAPELEAKTLFEWLNEREGEKYQEGQLRTLQRRISKWRVMNKPQVLICLLYTSDAADEEDSV